MNFDLYYPYQRKDGRWVPGVRPKVVTGAELLEVMRSKEINDLVRSFQDGDKDSKLRLPAVCWTGRCKGDYRRDSEMQPTQLVMIDIDHVEKADQKLRNLISSEHDKLEEEHLLVAHITPSGKGIRLVFRACREIVTLSEYMLYLDEVFHFHQLGDFDPAVKNIGRLSFLPPSLYVIYWSEKINEEDTDPVYIMGAGESITSTERSNKKAPTSPAASDNKQTELSFEGGVAKFSDSEKETFEAFRYRGFELPVIIKKYLEVFGEPGSGERHNYYNEMVKNFRCICDNNKRLLLYYLPSLGHSEEERWSQIVSICRVNTLSRLPKQFYFFLVDNGFYEKKSAAVNDIKEYMMSEEVKVESDCPYFPPVFRELVGIAPKDFVVPAVNALLPILGTLTSYVRSTYPYDGREHSTSFFSVIYAPPGTGKGFVERFMDLLFVDLKLRDFVESARENVYLRVIVKKGDNEKSPERPNVSLRIIPAKNSEAEFLEKQRDNNGYHMFTYAAEMDSWAKGVRAAGGNKDDMIRIAWDNGEYGQQFKSANTFKGMVKLYWNVLITGTIQQVETYFKNVENGLVTRCSFCSIENQEFSLPPVWKSLRKRDLEVISRFRARCDSNTYESPCTIDPSEVLGTSDDDFDKSIDWRFKFREKKNIDMSWIMPTIDKFHEEQMRLAALDVDRARDVFRRRVGVRGFRLAMICYCLWDKPRESDLQKCIPFIDWWMHKDLENILHLWGAKYNEQTDYVPHVSQRTVFDALGETFNRLDVYNVCMKQGIKTPVRRILFDWRKMGYIETLSKDSFKKVLKNKK